MKSLLGITKFKFLLTGERFENNEFEPTIVGANVPGLEMGTVQQPNPMRIIHRPGDSLEFDDLRIMLQPREDLSDWLTIYQWMIDMRNHSNMDVKEIFSDANLVILTNKNNPSLVLNFENIFPTSLQEIDLNYEHVPDPINYQVTFKYLTFKVLSNI